MFRYLERRPLGLTWVMKSFPPWQRRQLIIRSEAPDAALMKTEGLARDVINATSDLGAFASETK